jgi:purine catabolism regulator
VSIGVSTPYKDIKNIAQLRDESYLASLFTKRGIIYYKSLDTIKLLYPLKDDKEIQEYYSRTIKKLEDYDEINNSNLIKTLETYFRYNLRKGVVSEKLFIHVETLRYRLNKIEEITGYSINDSEGLFALQMGVKLRSLLKLR